MTASQRAGQHRSTATLSAENAADKLPPDSDLPQRPQMTSPPGVCARQELVRAGRQPGPPLHPDLPAAGPGHGRAHGLRRHRGVSAPPHQHPDTPACLAQSAATRRPWPDRADRRRDQARLQPDHRTWQPIRHYLRWSWWRRRHQARARWFHQRARLRKRAAGHDRPRRTAQAASAVPTTLT